MKRTTYTVRMIHDKTATVPGYVYSTGKNRVGISNISPDTGDQMGEWYITDLRTGYLIGRDKTLKAARIRACRLIVRYGDFLNAHASGADDLNPGIVPEYTILCAY